MVARYGAVTADMQQFAAALASKPSASGIAIAGCCGTCRLVRLVG